VAIGGLFATHPEESGNQNLGAACREIGLGSDGKIVDGIERRFRRLLSSRDTADVIAQLRSWVRLAASKGVGIGYEGLFADLWNWRWYSDEIRVKWARAFWQAGEPASDPTSQAPTANRS